MASQQKTYDKLLSTGFASRTSESCLIDEHGSLACLTNDSHIQKLNAHDGHATITCLDKRYKAVLCGLLHQLEA